MEVWWEHQFSGSTPPPRLCHQSGTPPASPRQLLHVLQAAVHDVVQTGALRQVSKLLSLDEG